jgi:hypothetical protein
MSIFITGLAFAAEPATQDAAKVGIFAGSFGSAVAGLALLRRVGAKVTRGPESRNDEGEVRVLVDLPQFDNDYRLAQWSPRGALVGQTLGELDVRGRHGVNVLGAWPGDASEVTPTNRKLKPVGGNYRIGLGDTLLLVGEREAVAAFIGLDGEVDSAEREPPRTG